jgi:hypothetical protein
MKGKAQANQAMCHSAWKACARKKTNVLTCIDAQVRLGQQPEVGVK